MSGADEINAMLESWSNASVAIARMPKVFPGYIAMRIKNAIRKPENGLIGPNLDFPGAEIGDVETIGDCRYAMSIVVKNGTRCRIIVEVEDAPAR